jgi:hypothetical protein
VQSPKPRLAAPGSVKRTPVRRMGRRTDSGPFGFDFDAGRLSCGMAVAQLVLVSHPFPLLQQVPTHLSVGCRLRQLL